MSMESSEAKAEKACAIIKISRLLMTNLLGAQQKKLAYEEKSTLLAAFMNNKLVRYLLPLGCHGDSFYSPLFIPCVMTEF